MKPRRGRPLVTMREALKNPDIFNAGDPSWLAWNVLSIAVMGEPLENDEEREIFTLLTGLDREPLERVDELVCCKGRRSGGTTAAARVQIYVAALHDYRDCLDPGEQGVALFLATTVQQASVAHQRAVGIIQASSLLRSMVTRETAGDIELSNNVTLSVRSASARSLRGITLVGLCADEAAHYANEGDSSDAEVLATCRPALATTGGICVITSSPWRSEGEFYTLHQKYFGKYDGDKVLVSHSTTRQTNPELPQSTVDRAMARDPVKARCEFLSEFRTDISDYVPRQIIESAVDVGVASRPPVQGVRYAAFCDAASGISPAAGGAAKGDTFSMAIGHRQGDTIIIDLIYAKAPPFNASGVVAEICAIARAYGGVDTMVSDRYSQGFMQSELQRNGLAWKPSDYDKSGLYALALPMFTSNKVRLTDDRATVEQFCLLERKPTSGNRDRIDARGGKSEDSANAVAGVLALLTQPVSNAENFLTFMKWQIEGRPNRFNTDVDDIRAIENPEIRAAGPAFGFPQAIKQHRVRIPDEIGTLFLIDGTQLQIPEDRIVSVSAEDAAAFGMRGWDRLASV